MLNGGLPRDLALEALPQRRQLALTPKGDSGTWRLGANLQTGKRVPRVRSQPLAGALHHDAATRKESDAKRQWGPADGRTGVRPRTRLPLLGLGERVKTEGGRV